MKRKISSKTDLVLYSACLITAFSFILISTILSTPILQNLDLNKSLIELLFYSETEFSYGWSLIFPMLLLITGVSILIILLGKIIKSIIYQNDSKLNKVILSILAGLLVMILVRAFQNSWELLILNLKYMIITIFLIVTFFTIINQFARQRNYD
ncbi:hypothetical protein ACIQ34_18155 [Ureibacillus sp. NPDC094379]